MEIPILFQGPMVRAIIADNKSMTRRLRGLTVINEHPDDWWFVGNNREHDFPYPIDMGRHDYPWYCWSKEVGRSETFISQCPYGKIGDILWVRENWCEPILFDGNERDYYYQADEIKLSDFHSRFISGKWKPSIHMPRVACRILLQVVNVWVERLHDICRDECEKEGIERTERGMWTNYNPDKKMQSKVPSYVQDLNNAISSFESLWRSVNGNESWVKNPWVWVIEFKKL